MNQIVNIMIKKQKKNNKKKVYVYNFAARSIVLVSTMLDVWIASERLMLIRNATKRSLVNTRTRLVLPYFVLAALVVYLPAMYFVDIKHKLVNDSPSSSSYTVNQPSSSRTKQSTTQRVVYYHEFNLTSQPVRLLVGLEMSVRGWLMGIVLCVLTALICVSIRRRAESRARIRRLRLKSLRAAGAANGELATTTITGNESSVASEQPAPIQQQHTHGKANKQVKRRHHKSSSNKTAGEIKHITRFVIVMCLVFVVGNVMHSFKFLVRYVLFETLAETNVYALVADTLIFASQSLNLFLYYAFNSHFRRECCRLFNKMP